MSKEICPVCGEDKEDMRHVSVECFYQIDETVKKMKKEQFFSEVPIIGTYWGITRKYAQGKIDNYEHKQLKDKLKTIKMTNKPKKIGAIRLMEKTLFRIDCCKNCRGEFIELLKRWTEGEFVDRKPEYGAGIPVRKNGRTVLVTRKELEEIRDENENEKIVGEQKT